MGLIFYEYAWPLSSVHITYIVCYMFCACYWWEILNVGLDAAPIICRNQGNSGHKLSLVYNTIFALICYCMDLQISLEVRLKSWRIVRIELPRFAKEQQTVMSLWASYAARLGKTIPITKPINILLCSYHASSSNLLFSAVWSVCLHVMLLSATKPD
jgi:hypothetical protein